MKKIAPIISSAILLFAHTNNACAQRAFDPDKGEVKDGVATIKGLEAIFENIVTVVLALGALTVFIMFLVSGFKFITSGGDPKAVASARNTITYAVAGLVLLALAYLILVFIQAFTGAQITTFRIIPE